MIINNLHSLLTRWKQREFITVGVYRRINSTVYNLPKAYSLPKVHKPGYPLRIIVSSNNSPLYCLSKFLHELIYNSIPPPGSHVKNSFELVKKLDISVDESCELISLNVVSLFTNIPLDLTIDSINRTWDYIKNNTVILQNEFIIVVRFVLNSTYFFFNDTCYKQTFGTPPMVLFLIPFVNYIFLYI